MNANQKAMICSEHRDSGTARNQAGAANNQSLQTREWDPASRFPRSSQAWQYRASNNISKVTRRLRNA
jgi:hypothetical protein